MSLVPVVQWDQLVSLHGGILDTNILMRSATVFMQYDAHKRHLAENGIDIETYIFNTIFGEYDETAFVVTYNNFPYSIDKEIAHLVFWINPLYVCDNIDNICNYITENGLVIITEGSRTIAGAISCGLKQGADYVVVENSAKNKSIKSIQHYHIFIRKDNIKWPF